MGAGLISNRQPQRDEAKFNLPAVESSQLLQIRCADLTEAKQEQFLASLKTVFSQFEVNLMQVEIIKSH